jgi:serine/threonine-protein kinase
MEGRIMPGDHLGHFELIEYVGGGGMGRVYRAMDTRLARIVALKILPPDQAADSETVQRFANEAQSAARLDHENIARVHYVGEDRGVHFIAFEFVEGENIRKLVERKGPLPLEEAISYTLQAVDALAHADARHIVHRDIKPSNILITPGGQVKLIDMGLARLRQAESMGVDLTSSGVTLGTFDYISPEQARDPRSADIRSDIYSLGCTFYFMLAGRPPFPDGTVLQKLLQHHGDPPPDVRQVRADLPEQADDILQKMMAKDPNHRYSDPNDLISDLLALAGQLGLQPFNPGGREWLPKPAPKVSPIHRHMPWVVSIAALACMLIALDIFWKVSSPGRQDPSALPFDRKESVVKSAESKADLPPGVEDEKTKSLAIKDKPTSENAPDSAGKSLRASANASPRKSPQEIWRLYPPANPAVNAGQVAAASAASTSQSPSKSSVAFKTPQAGGSSQQSGHADFSPGSGISTTPAPDHAQNDLSREMPAATSSQAEPGENASPAGTLSKHNALLVVSDLAAGDNEFTNLPAACAAARNGDVIELRYNGPREEKPVHMANLRATIRAGEGYQPVLVFRPNETDPVKYPRSMFSLSSGRLTISNLAMELIIPRDIAADNWSMLEIRGGQTVRLEKCALTVANASDQLTAYHQDAAFFRVGASPGAESKVAGGNAGAPPLATIELYDSIARGEAAFIRVDALQPVHLAWDNGLLATSEWLLWAAGGTQSPKPDEMLRIDLQHVTIAARGGLVHLTSSQAAPHQFTVQFNCAGNIIMTSHGNSLIEQEVVGSLENARRQIVWNGDHNFYQDVNVFWTIRGLGSEPTSDKMSFEGWRAYWGPSRENQPFFGRIERNNLPGPDCPPHTQTPADFSLNEAAIENTAIGEAGDGRNAGMQIDRLMVLPLPLQADGSDSSED